VVSRLSPHCNRKSRLSSIHSILFSSSAASIVPVWCLRVPVMKVRDPFSLHCTFYRRWEIYWLLRTMSAWKWCRPSSLSFAALGFPKAESASESRIGFPKAESAFQKPNRLSESRVTFCQRFWRYEEDFIGHSVGKNRFRANITTDLDTSKLIVSLYGTLVGKKLIEATFSNGKNSAFGSKHGANLTFDRLPLATPKVS
jgi:hypothetical protein